MTAEGRARRALRRLAATYFAFDPRSLALFRVALGTVLFIDLWQRFRGIDYWYTDDGLLPRKLLGGVSHLYSLFLHVSTREGALALMALCAAVYFCFTVGFLTRWSHALALVCVVSLNSRVFVLENGGNFVLNLLTTWTLFLPLGRRFSVDALIASLRARREPTVEALADRDAMRIASDRPVWSLAVLALLLQFGTIYALNVVQKTGLKWTSGSAVYYVLHDDRLNTLLAVWMREYLPYSVLHVLSYATLVVEAAAVPLILSPLWSRHARLAAIVLLPALHAGFTACLMLGGFSFAMMAFFMLLPAAEHWRWWERFRRRRTDRLRATAWIDPSDRACLQLARLYARLDPHQRVRFVAGSRNGVNNGLSVLDEASGREVQGFPATLELIRRLPGMAPLAGLVRVLRLSGIGDRLQAALWRRREGVARLLRLAPADPRSGPARRLRWPRARAAGRVSRFVLGQAAVAVLIAAAVGDLVHSNPAIPPAWRYRQPDVLNAVVWVPRNRQFWRMFAPEPPGSVLALSVEARTRQGRTVDPYNQVASRIDRLPAEGEMPVHFGRYALFAYYTRRVVSPEHAWLRPGLEQWILRYPERTGRPEDAVVGFEVYQVSAPIPAPGAEPIKYIGRRRIMSYR